MSEILATILETVINQESPTVGLTARQIREQSCLNLGSQRLRWQLNKLETLNLISSRPNPLFKPELLYFPGAYSSKIAAVLFSSRPAIIAAIITANPGINFREVLAKCRLNISPFQMGVELRSLRDKGLIYFEFDPKHKKRVLYFPVINDAKEK